MQSSEPRGYIMSEGGGAVSVAFANDRGGDGDLLQQAFQQVIEDEERPENEFVAFLQNDAAGETQIIQLTAEQAAALGIDGQLEDGEQSGALDGAAVSEEYRQCVEGQPGLQRHQTQSLGQEETQRIVNELTQSGLLKRKEAAAFNEWTVQSQNGQNANYEQESLESNLTLNTVTIENNQEKKRNHIEEKTNNFLQIQSNQTESLLQEQNVAKTIKTQCNGNVLQNRIQFSIASNSSQVDNISVSQAQIMQRFPVILPSSQFILKPAQTVLTPVKNIRILPNATKVSTAQTSQNSLLLPKTTLLNTVSPQLIKAVPVGTQFLNTANNISTQLLNVSQLRAKINSSNNNQLINESQITTSNVNNISTLTQNLVRQTTVQKPVQAQISQKTNLQQFFTPILKTTSNAIAVVKNTSLLNSNALLNKRNSSNSPLKTINPSQMLKNTLVKNPVISLPTTKNTNTPVIFKTSVIKSEDTKLASTSSPTIRTQISNTPVSILKPQTKTVNSNIVNNNLARNNLTSLLMQKSPLSKSIELSDSLKPLVTAKLKQSVNSIMKSIKKKTIPQKLITVKQDNVADVNKPLGSSENPIQILQQGDTYHSMHRLTQAQLKHIAQVLHQRTQETSSGNEKVVYRLVFPDELDLRMKASTSLLKNKNGKRGRPKKGAVKNPGQSTKSAGDEEQDDTKDDRKKVVARTRSGRLSRPPRHIVRDYKHLHHVDLGQPDPEDSDGGYSDYNNASGSAGKLDDEEAGAGQRTELLAGLEVPKRKISDHFRCPTCSKIYLGRTRMARHFEMHPDHGSPDQLPPPTVEAELKPVTPQDPLKRKGKKRGPWAYVTPEAKSERRKLKLREAISVCDSAEIAKIAAKPVLDSLSLFDLLVLKSENNVRTFLAEIKELVERIREKTGRILSVACNDDDKHSDDVVDLNEELLCDVLALNSGFYRVNESLSVEENEPEDRHLEESFEMSGAIEPPMKVMKTENTITEEGKENSEERLSSGFSESSDVSVSDFFNERRSESALTSINCPEVLSALTLMPRNSSASPETEAVMKANSTGPKVVNTGMEIHAADGPGFQKLSINAATRADPNFVKEGAFTKLGDTLETSCSDVFTKFNGGFDQAKMDSMQRTFIKLEPTEEGFIKLENGIIGGFHEEIGDFGKIQSNGFHYISGSISDNFTGKGFRKLVPKTTMSTSTNSILKKEELDITDAGNSHDVINESSIQITTNSNSNSTDTNIFESTDNLDISKITGYDHITHLDILNGSGVIDEKLVEHYQLVDNSNIVDELVSERLKSMMPENLLESNLLQTSGNLDTELDFDELSEEFNRNTRS